MNLQQIVNQYKNYDWFEELDFSGSKNKKWPINLSNIAGEFVDIAGEKVEETLAFGKKLLGRLFK
jgi:hypothetical protein